MPDRAARLLFQLPNKCRVYAKIAPASQWGWEEVLANKANYLLETLVWMKTKDAQKKAPRNRPKPYVPDFLEAPRDDSGLNKDTEALAPDDIRDILSKPRV